MPELVSWLGNASYGVAGPRSVRVTPLTAFIPSDISGLQMWLDANDPSTVNSNPFGTVESWHNKGDLSGNFDLSGGGADIRYGFNSVNGLEVVTFTGDAYMTGTFALNFQDRSIFIVSRRNTNIDPSGNVFTWLTSDTTDGMETGISQSGVNFTYLVATHPGFSVELGFTTKTDTTGYAELATFQNSSTDLSGNYAALNSDEQTLVVSNLAAYETASIQYYLGNYFGGSSLPNDYDLCELILYDSVLTSDQRDAVEEYLTLKWGIVAPPPPPPVPPTPFVPTDISGLQMWMDGSNVSSLSLSGSDVLSWSNVGSAGGLFAQSNGVATYLSSSYLVAMPQATTLDAYFSLPYYSRTTFGVLEVVDDLTTSAYPYVNFMDGQASDARQAGVNYDSNAPTFQFTICQSGTNCPVVAPFAAMSSGLLLVTGVVDSNDGSNNAGYLNNGSNINTSTDLGNLFNQNPLPYIIGSSNASSPAFRMGEFLEYDTVLSSSNISTVTSYLNTKWSLGL
jgi:hypothetical protein